MKQLLYKVTDGLGLVFCETFFRILNTFYQNEEPPKIIAWILDRMYRAGCWFYSINKNVD